MKHETKTPQSLVRGLSQRVAFVLCVCGTRQDRTRQGRTRDTNGSGRLGGSVPRRRRVTARLAVGGLAGADDTLLRLPGGLLDRREPGG